MESVEEADAASHASHCWQDVWVPAHLAPRETDQLLQQETPDFISPDLWPPNSLDLNPVDYRIKELMQGRVYNTPDRDTSDLEQRLIDTRASISTKHVHA